MAASAIAAAPDGRPGDPSLPPEVLVGAATIIDYEFDYGRDGVYCTACNFGAGNARLTWFDQDTFNLWVANVDVATGNFVPSSGMGTLVTGNIATGSGDGPEWAASQLGSQIVYTTYLPGTTRSPGNFTIGVSSMTSATTWSSTTLPNGKLRATPVASLNLSDPTPRLDYHSSGIETEYWRDLANPSVEFKFPSTLKKLTSRRWVAGTHKIIVICPAAPDSTGTVYEQVFTYDTDTLVVEQLTFDPTDKTQASFMFAAPEFNNEMVFFAVTGGTRLNIYRKLPNSSGVPVWTVINAIDMPADLPYIGSPEPFIHNGHSWIFFDVCAQPQDSAGAHNTAIGLTGIDPATPNLKLLTSASSPARFRSDPEYFITANGPYIYYNRYVALPRKALASEGVYRVDTGLGPRVN